MQKLLGDERVHDVTMMFTRHRWFVPYALFSGIALFVVSTASGVGGPLNRLVLTLCGAAIAALATTNYWVLAQTEQGLVLLRSSRIRQYARKVEARLGGTDELEMVGSTVITSDWRIGETMYTLTKRWEPAMRRIAQEH